MDQPSSPRDHAFIESAAPITIEGAQRSPSSSRCCSGSPKRVRWADLPERPAAKDDEQSIECMHWSHFLPEMSPVHMEPWPVKNTFIDFAAEPIRLVRHTTCPSWFSPGVAVADVLVPPSAKWEDRQTLTAEAELMTIADQQLSPQ